MRIGSKQNASPLFISLFILHIHLHTLFPKKKKKRTQTKTYKQLLHVGRPSLLLPVINTEHAHAETKKYKVIKKKKIYTRVILHKEANTTLH